MRALENPAEAAAAAENDEQMRARWEQWQTALSDNARLLHSQQQEMTRQGETLAKVLEATGDDGARASAPFTAPFRLKRWTCVAVEYRPGAGGGRLQRAPRG